MFLALEAVNGYPDRDGDEPCDDGDGFCAAAPYRCAARRWRAAVSPVGTTNVRCTSL